jgi:hypothetical protein
LDSTGLLCHSRSRRSRTSQPLRWHCSNVGLVLVILAGLLLLLQRNISIAFFEKCFLPVFSETSSAILNLQLLHFISVNLVVFFGVLKHIHARSSWSLNRMSNFFYIKRMRILRPCFQKALKSVTVWSISSIFFWMATDPFLCAS